jgi:hypothetical protein
MEHLDLVRGLLKGRHPGIARASLYPGPDWLYDPAATAPFVVYRCTSADRGAPTSIVAVDTRTDTGYYRRREGVSALFGAIGYPAKRQLTPRAALAAWLAIAYSVDPDTIAEEAAAAVDPRHGALVHPPRGSVEGAHHVIVGWTWSWKGRVIERHTLRVGPDGAIEARIDPAESLLRD